MAPLTNFFPHCRKAIPLLLCLLTAFLAGCSKEEPIELAPPIVTVTKVVEEKVQDWDEYTGRLEPVGSVEIRPRVSGYITEVKFIDGDLVKKGQPLFIIDPRPYQADYDRAKGDLDKAESALKLASTDFDRARQLREKGVTAATDFDQRAATFQQASGSLASAKSALEAAKLNLEFCTIFSPIDGRVSRANITVGNLVTADSTESDKPLTTVVTTNPVYAYADVDERSLLRYQRYYLSKGKGNEDVDEVKMPVHLALQDETDFPHTGYIDFVDNRVDPTTGTVRMRGIFDSEKALLGPGYFVRIQIPAGDAYNATLIPQRAVASGQGQKFAIVVGKDNVAEFRPLVLGSLQKDMQVVKSGLKEGETVIVDGVLKARPGEKVDPKPLPAQPAATPAAK